jgi:TatD DNase family protein
MLLADSHTHLYLPEFDADRDEMIDRARSEGIEIMLMPNIDAASVNPMLAAAERHKGVCFPMIGLHPTSVKEDYLVQLDNLKEVALKHKFVAIGEIGIDLYWDKTHITRQIDAFRKQLNWALVEDLPVVIHSRESFPEVFNVLSEFKGSGIRGVMHAFSGSMEDAEKAIALGFMLGIGGPLTFKNSGLPPIIKEAGLQNIILETDSPYLAPVPYRGKRNESSYLRLINSKLAEFFDINEEETASVTFNNTCRLFKIC